MTGSDAVKAMLKQGLGPDAAGVCCGRCSATPLVIWPELAANIGLSCDKQSVQQMQYLRIKDWLVDGAMADASLAIDSTSTFLSAGKTKWFTRGAEPCWSGHCQLAISERVTLGPECRS